MKTVFIINAHQAYPFSKGQANATFVNLAQEFFTSQGYRVRYTHTQEPYNVEEEVEKHRASDLVLLQTPINWMGVSWSFKKYMDEVYTLGMMGTMCDGDGRSADRPKENYGMGGLLTHAEYMLSITTNAPEEAFDNPADPFFEGMSLDDLFRPMHLNFKFMGMRPLPTFAAYDLMKNGNMEADQERFRSHLATQFAEHAH